MQRVHRSVLVPYSAQQMFDLVDDVERYPEFLPWCGGSKVLARRGDRTTARIDISYLGVQSSFTTDNVNVPGKSIAMALKEGPFERLSGKWTFKPLAKDGCKVEFSLSYEFQNSVLEALIGPVFDQIARTFIDAFVQRAEATYAKRK